MRYATHCIRVLAIQWYRYLFAPFFKWSLSLSHTHSLRILCSFFHLRTTIIKNNLHLLFFLLFALFSCILFSTYTHTETAFLFIYLLSAVFFLLLLFYFPLFVVCVFFCCLRIRRLRAHHLYLPLVLYEKCRCFHASECVEMCFDCRALVTWCANNCKKYL